MRLKSLRLKHNAFGEGSDSCTVVPMTMPPKRSVRASLGFREFQLPPVGDGLLIGKRATIGPTALFEALERMLPGTYERIDVEDGVVESVIVHKSRLRIMGRDKLVELAVSHGSDLMDETTCLHLSLDAEVTFDVEVQT